MEKPLFMKVFKTFCNAKPCIAFYTEGSWFIMPMVNGGTGIISVVSLFVKFHLSRFSKKIVDSKVCLSSLARHGPTSNRGNVLSTKYYFLSLIAVLYNEPVVMVDL